MAFANISDFIQTLQEHQELIVCDTPVSTYLEITEITDRFSKQTSAKNKAILFTQTGTKFPVLINAFGSESRINIALGTDSLDDIRIRIESLFS
ncbi:MAG: UbiD family decarboxylase, partial [Bacteroidales bacterium]|nr:UbiD family decarboxylase [Bacteroidales bacterium]